MAKRRQQERRGMKEGDERNGEVSEKERGVRQKEVGDSLNGQRREKWSWQ